MIVKRITIGARGRDGASRARHARQLVDYLHKPDKEVLYREQIVRYLQDAAIHRDTERLLHLGARNFVCDDRPGSRETLLAQRAEMMATAQAASRTDNPVDHWLLSWRENELPTKEQIDQTVAMFLADMGASNLQVIYAAHGDTHNVHVHLAMNRYDPLAERMVSLGERWDREAAHQSIARIVDHFGWEAEAGARYRVINGTMRARAGAEIRPADGKRAGASKSPLRHALAYERRTGYRSAERILGLEAPQLIETAKDWGTLHAALAARGITYDRLAKGAVLALGDERVKSSAVSRHATLKHLEARLGPFQPRPFSLAIAPRDYSEDVLPGAFRADEYRKERERRTQTPPMRSRPRHGTAAAKSSSFPADLEEWLRSKGEIWFAESWRRRVQMWEIHIRLLDQSIPLGKSIGPYQPFPCADGVRYAEHKDAPTVFIDRGDRIGIVPQVSEEAMLAALRLAIAKSKDGLTVVKGAPEFKKAIYKLAIAHGLEQSIANPDFPAYHALITREQPSPSFAQEPSEPTSSQPKVVRTRPVDPAILSGITKGPGGEKADRSASRKSAAPTWEVSRGGSARKPTSSIDYEKLRRVSKGPPPDDPTVDPPKTRGPER